MAKQSKSIFVSKGWKTGMKYLYGWGAAVVILGALFKILHLPGADIALIVGLSTESVIFFFSAFEPLPPEDEHYDWTRVYPQLKESEFDGEEDEEELDGVSQAPARIDTSFMADASKHLTPQLFEDLAATVTNVKNAVDGTGKIVDVGAASNSFSDSLSAAKKNVESMSDGFGKSASTMKQFNESLTKVKEDQMSIQKSTEGYKNEIQKVTKNLNSLNAIYELEIQESQKHISSINKFYGSISSVMKNMLDTSKETEALRQEVGVLTKNIRSLNTVYGNMLSAMASAGGSSK